MSKDETFLTFHQSANPDNVVGMAHLEINIAQQRATLDSKAACWNAKDTLRELSQKNLPI